MDEMQGDGAVGPIPPWTQWGLITILGKCQAVGQIPNKDTSQPLSEANVRTSSQPRDKSRPAGHDLPLGCGDGLHALGANPMCVDSFHGWYPNPTSPLVGKAGPRGGPAITGAAGLHRYC